MRLAEEVRKKLTKPILTGQVCNPADPAIGSLVLLIMLPFILATRHNESKQKHIFYATKS